ncbi:MAG: molybdopterin-dependent oxidoreductase, partial [Gammaproteobacteria bacterium]|nr:molybdopterin-dependent oxidoreductase [Gammaproteobacteria bacterium]
MRVVPRENEAINEIWIADRDRFSYEGVYSSDRLRTPLVRRGAEWSESDWEPALMLAAEGLKDRAASLGVLASPSSTTEELYLAARIARGLDCPNIDHRLRQRDFRDQAADPAFPGLGLRIAEVDSLDALLVIGSNLRREAPILAHRVRKAAKRGAKVAMLNPARFPYHFPLASYLSCTPGAMATELAALLAAAAEAAGQPVPEHLAQAVRGATVTDAHRSAAQALLHGTHRAIWLGALAARHPAFADLRALAAALAQLAGASFGRITEGANSAGAYLAGAVPHREAGGKPLAQPGLTVREMLATPLRAYVLFGGVEPGIDTLDAEALRTLAQAELVVAITPYASEEVKRIAHVMLPIGTFAETSGTYVNCEGTWQSQAGAATAVGTARPGWKVLRVLGNLLNLPRFEYLSSEDVLAELRAACAGLEAKAYAGNHAVEPPGNGPRVAPPVTVADVPMYQVDALVRRAASLQRTRDGRTPLASY